MLIDIYFSYRAIVSMYSNEYFLGYNELLELAFDCFHILDRGYSVCVYGMSNNRVETILQFYVWFWKLTKSESEAESSE